MYLLSIEAQLDQLTIFDKESELHFLPKVEGILIDI
jgi:hypothetical protein